MRHGLELAGRSPAALAAVFNTELSRAVRHLEKRSEAARDIIAMHKRHGELVGRVLEQTLRANAASVVDGTLNPTSLLTMVAKGQHVPAGKWPMVGPVETGSAEGTPTSVRSEQVPVAAILASLQNLHAKIDAGPIRSVPKNTNARPKRRDSILFAAIILGMEGTRYCAFLKEHGVTPRWEPPCPSHYDTGYKAGQPWRKKIQDEKCRARTRMKGYANSALADAFNFHFPGRFEELSGLLNSRNSRPASKT